MEGLIFGILRQLILNNWPLACQDGHLMEVQPYNVTEKVSSFFS